MEKIIVFIILLMLSQTIRLNCDLITSLNYSTNSIENCYLASLNFGRGLDRQSYGVYNEFRKIDFSSGIRINNGKIKYAYDFSIFSYLAFYKIPLSPIDDKHEKLNFDSHELNNGPAYLTFSFKGPELSNVGMYEKDYNWSSVGIDFLYKRFKQNEFYTRFSFIVSASTIKNNMNYFSQMDITDKTKFCMDMKIKNSTNLFIPYFNCSEWKLESYYRIIFNNSTQKEIGVNLKYEYLNFFPLYLNTQIGYIKFSANNYWKDLFKFNLGISYVFLRGHS